MAKHLLIGTGGLPSWLKGAGKLRRGPWRAGALLVGGSVAAGALLAQLAPAAPDGQVSASAAAAQVTADPQPSGDLQATDWSPALSGLTQPGAAAGADPATPDAQPVDPQLEARMRAAQQAAAAGNWRGAQQPRIVEPQRLAAQRALPPQQPVDRQQELARQQALAQQQAAARQQAMAQQQQQQQQQQAAAARQQRPATAAAEPARPAQSAPTRDTRPSPAPAPSTSAPPRPLVPGLLGAPK